MTKTKIPGTKVRTCRIMCCDKHCMRGLDLCSAHYSRLRRHGTPLPPHLPAKPGKNGQSPKAQERVATEVTAAAQQLYNFLWDHNIDLVFNGNACYSLQEDRALELLECWMTGKTWDPPGAWTEEDDGC